MRRFIYYLSLVCAVIVLSSCNLCHLGKNMVPPEFEYRQGWVTEDVDQVDAKSLSGVVFGPGQSPIKLALVEQMTSDWKQRISARLTDENGKFHFPGVNKGVVYIRVRNNGFNDQRIPVHVTGKGSDLTITLRISN